jgi:hypothetical protein
MPDQEEIQINFNPSSFLAALARVNKAREDMEKGVEGAAGRMSSAYSALEKSALSFADKAERAIARQVDSYVRVANAAGMSASQKILANEDALIKKLGNRAAEIDKVRAATQRLLEVERQQSSGSGSGLLFARGARDLFEGRTAYGEVQIGKGLASLSGLPLILGGAAAAFGGLTAAAIASYRSLAEYGTQVREVELRTGFTSKEVAQFGFAAKVTGQEISVFERGMRGLTVAVEDQSAAGERARGWLTKFGVDLQGVRDGTVSTGEVFEQISTGVSNLSNTFERNKALLDLFKRSGIDIIPVMEQLNPLLKTAREQGFGATESEVNRFLEYQKNLVLVETTWGEIVRHVKEYLAALASGAIGAVNAAKGRYPQPLTNPGAEGIGSIYDLPATPYPSIPDALGYTLQLKAAQRAGDAGRISAYLSSQGSDYRLKAAEKALGQIPEVTAGGIPPPGMTVTEWITARRAAESLVDSIKAQNKALEQQKSIQQDIAKIGIEVQEKLGFTGKGTEADRMLGQFTTRQGVTPAEIEQVRRLLIPLQARISQEAITKGTGLAQEADRRIALGLDTPGERDLDRVGRSYLESLKQRNDLNTEGIKLSEELLTLDRKQKESAAISAVQVATTLGIQTPGNKLAAEREIAQIKVNAANEEYIAAAAKIKLDENAEMALQVLKLKHAEEIGDINQHLAEQVAEAQRKQIDSLQRSIEPVIATLFTHPSKFGPELLKVTRNAALSPLISGVSGLAAQAISPLFGGGLQSVQPINGAIPVIIVGGTGGGSGGVSGAGSEFRLAPSPRNFLTNPISFFTGGGGGGGGYSGGGYSGGGYSGGYSGGGSTSVGYSTLAPSYSDISTPPFISGGGGYGDYAPSVNTISYGGGGGGGGGYIGGGATSSRGGFNLGGISLGGSGTRSGGFSPFGNLKGLFSGGRFMNQDIYTSPGNATTPAGIGGFGGDAAGVLTSKGAAGIYAAVGTPLATAGLFGNARGTGLGVAESAGGGALLGASIGTNILPGIGTAIGAGIGLIAGAAAGVGELLTGDISPQQKVKRDVDSMYHVAIGDAEANRIVSLANSSYGGNIEVTVRSPQVRQMLGLYAAGTGQSKSFPMGADTPHGASLVEQGGKLYQQAVYQYGNPYTYQSNLPVYGGNPGGNLPTPGGNPSIALNISGTDVGNFMNGQYVTPSNVQGKYGDALAASTGRTDNSLMLQEPGTIVG